MNKEENADNNDADPDPKRYTMADKANWTKRRGEKGGGVLRPRLLITAVISGILSIPVTVTLF